MLGLGRLGGHALTHASDLDLIYLHTAPPEARVRRREAARPERLFQPARRAGSPRRSASRPRRARCTTSTRGSAPRAPRACSSSRSTRSSATSASEAWTWEHMALCRARPVFGSPAVREQVAAMIERHPAHAARLREGRRATPPRCAPRWSATSRRAAPLDVKLGPGGLVDLEFAVHVLQLTTPCRPRHPAGGGARGARSRIFGPGKYCRCAKVAVAHAGDDAAGRARRRQADAETWQLVAEACGAAQLGRAACRARRGAAEHRRTLEQHQARGVR